ncbi:chitin deacetylase, carbohydrate esterase family 4 protein [Pseudohyphozyma bogoriensis]|nr:chitin deacetylase, carbohydrate esterase family 4 protein [Pseudohyphozyma bogoriensis]
MFSPAALLVLLPLITLSSAGPANSYPTPDVSGPAPLQAWVDVYNAAKAAGKIPALPVATLVNGNPTYPTGTATGSSGVCSWTNAHCFGTNDVVAAPDGIIGIAFDDGPQLASPTLYNYLQSQKQKATHFMIGSRILDNPSIFQQAVTTGGHIAVHTWSHPYMTTMTDMQILGELGWTAQIIYDQSGHVPAFWRPPYGDIDNRVRAIAREVFGLYNVIWNQDTFDWCLTETGNACVGQGPQTDAGLDAELQGFYRGPKSPGLLILEHELTTRSVGGFIRNFPTLKSQGWTPLAIPDIWNVAWYQPNGSTVGSGENQNAGQSTASATNVTSTIVSTTSVLANATSAAHTNGSIPTNASQVPNATSVATGSVLITPTKFGSTVTAVAAATAVSTANVQGSVSKTSAGGRVEVGFVSVLAGVLGSSTYESLRDSRRLIATLNASLYSAILPAGPPPSTDYRVLPGKTEARTLEGGRKTNFVFRNRDSFDAAEGVVRRFGADNVGVLNMANAYTPGGGYLNGAMAQEEALCRRSTLYAHLTERDYYPIGEEGGLWSPGVVVFRESDDLGSVIWEGAGELQGEARRFKVGVISAAAINRPDIDRQGNYANPFEEILTRNKIIAILRIAKLQSLKALVLGAFGCGAFANPPRTMAKLFRQLLTEEAEFKDAFEEVSFAILERAGSTNFEDWWTVWKESAVREGSGEENAGAAASAGEGKGESREQEDGEEVVVDGSGASLEDEVKLGESDEVLVVAEGGKEKVSSEAGPVAVHAGDGYSEKRSADEMKRAEELMGEEVEAGGKEGVKADGQTKSQLLVSK